MGEMRQMSRKERGRSRGLVRAGLVAVPVALVAAGALLATGVVGAREVRAEQWIDASPEEIWEVLTRSDRSGDPFLLRLDGEVAVGESLGITVHPVGGGSMDFEPEVLEAVPGEVLSWRGVAYVRGLVDGVHSWELVEEDGGTRVVQSERFTGIVVPFLGGTLDGTRAGFAAQLAWVADEVAAS
ncbi:MAG: SRPBCC family protein [Actinomycetaceae bacterium]